MPRQTAVVEVVGGARPGRGEKPHPAAGQPAGDETQDGRARPIQPVKVVDDQQERLLGGHPAQQEQRRVGHDQPTGRRTTSETQRHTQRLPVRRIQLLDRSQQGEEDLVQPGEAEGPLEFRARGPQDPGPARGSEPADGVQQGRLADTGLAPEQHRPTVSG